MQRRDFFAAGILATLVQPLLARMGVAAEPEEPESGFIEIPGVGRFSLDPSAYNAETIAGYFEKDFPRGVQLVREYHKESLDALNNPDPDMMSKIAQPLIKQVRKVSNLPLIGPRLREGLMSKAEPEQVSEGSGAPVYYVNGIFTPKETALKEARALAKGVGGRPVWLFYNDGTAPGADGKLAGADIEEAYRDRVWPVYLTGLLTGKSLGLGVGSAMGGDSPLQHNPTTRQLASLLYKQSAERPEEPVSLVGYSQGAMIVRNALFTLALFDKQEFAEKKVAFVAPGLPLNDHEVWPKPTKFTPIVDPQDPIPAYFGLRGERFQTKGAAVKHHGWFKDGYVSRIKPEMLTL